jgi:hypothetical protein
MRQNSSNQPVSPGLPGPPHEYRARGVRFASPRARATGLPQIRGALARAKIFKTCGGQRVRTGQLAKRSGTQDPR